MIQFWPPPNRVKGMVELAAPLSMSSSVAPASSPISFVTLCWLAFFSCAASAGSWTWSGVVCRRSAVLGSIGSIPPSLLVAAQ